MSRSTSREVGRKSAHTATFRPPTEGQAWQKQLRDKYEAEGIPDGIPHLKVKKARVRPISRKMAEQIILRYEWLGTMASTSAHFGIFFGAYCAGVTCVGLNGSGAAGAFRHREFGIGPRDLATLARGACVHWAPTGTNSKLVSWTCRLLSEASAAKIIIAYADSDAGEVGTIYQACNWVHIGHTNAVTNAELVAPNGRMLNRATIAGYAKTKGVSFTAMREKMMEEGWRFQPNNPKLKYVYVLDTKDERLIERVEELRQPYPKRDDAPEA